MSSKKTFFSARNIGLVIFLVGALLYWLEFRRQPPSINAEPVRIEGKLGTVSVGRGAAFTVIDGSGKIRGSCHTQDCGYPNYRNDLGKDAVFWMKDRQVVQIEIGGAIKKSEESILGTSSKRQHIALVVSIIGALIIFGSYII